VLKGLSPLLTPDLLHALASAGHGDAIAIVDANFPAAAIAKRLVTLAGAGAPAVLNAVLSVLPVDDADPAPVRVMQGADPAVVSEPARDFATILEQHGQTDPAALDRQAFHQAAATAFVIIQTGERRFHGNILLIKGVLPPDTRL
jgi:L-fucose mutarotase